MSQITEDALVTPQMAFKDTNKAFEWYKKSFGATVLDTFKDEKTSKMMHSHVSLPNGSGLFMHDEISNELSDSKTSIVNHLTFDTKEELESFWNNAIKNDMKVLMKLEKQYWGDLYAMAVDPFGYKWSFGIKKKYNYSKEKTNGKKRTLEESQSTDMESKESKESNNNSTNANTNTSNKKQKLNNNKGSIIGVKTIDTMRGLFLDCKVGKFDTECTHKCFGSAWTTMCKTLMKVINKNEELSKNMQKCIGIGPDDPKCNSICRYYPGFTFDLSIDLKKYEQTLKMENGKEISIIVKEVPKGECFGYLHSGPYEGLLNAWKDAFKAVIATDYVISTCNNRCYELYLNSPEDVKGDMSKLKTELWIGVRKP